MGFVVDISDQTFSIDDEKLDEIHVECLRAFLHPVISRRDLQSLFGKVLYISRCVKGARIFHNRILQVYRDNHAQVSISPSTEFYLDLGWFLQFLHSFNGVKTFRISPVQQTAFVDATLTHVGGIWGSRAYSLTLPNLIQGLIPITQCEMFNIVIALHMWAHLWQNKVIALKCDNESAVYVCNTGKTRDSFLNICSHRIWHLTAKHNIDLRVSHIQGCRNVMADALSSRKFKMLGDLQWEYLSPETLLFHCRVETRFAGITSSRPTQNMTLYTAAHQSSI